MRRIYALIFLTCASLLCLIFVVFYFKVTRVTQNVEISAFFVIISLSSLIACIILLITKVLIPIQQIVNMIDAFESTDSFHNKDMLVERPSMLSDRLNSLFDHFRDVMEKEYAASITKKQAEINALQSQINPHFLYNTLDSIRGQALAEGVDEIAEMTEALATYFRYTISQKRNIVSLEDELKNVDNYLVIQKYRFNNKISLCKIFDEEDQGLFECSLPKLTLQPVVENAIYHGLETKFGPGTVTIRAYRTQKRLVISVSDDGIGMSQQKLDKLNTNLRGKTPVSKTNIVNPGEQNTGIGLINVNDRIKLYYGDLYGISVSSTEGVGTDIEIVLPLRDYIGETERSNNLGERAEEQ